MMICFTVKIKKTDGCKNKNQSREREQADRLRSRL